MQWRVVCVDNEMNHHPFMNSEHFLKINKLTCSFFFLYFQQ